MKQKEVNMVGSEIGQKRVVLDPEYPHIGHVTKSRGVNPGSESDYETTVVGLLELLETRTRSL